MASTIKSTNHSKELPKELHLAKALHLVGFGSQGRAWAACARASGWAVDVYLPDGSATMKTARDEGYRAHALRHLADSLRSSRHSNPLVAMLCPDDRIGPVYRDYLAMFESELTLVLAHGYSVYAGELKAARVDHHIALLAPKAIGPKLMAKFFEARTNGLATHDLVAAVTPGADLQGLSEALGFTAEHLVRASFDQETMGDLISEQGLLCGGVFSLLEWTAEEMKQAGVPDALIREECLTELELIAGMLRTRGPEATFLAISQAAQCGTVKAQDALERSGARAVVKGLADDVRSRRFATEFRKPEWRERARAIAARLQQTLPAPGGPEQ